MHLAWILRRGRGLAAGLFGCALGFGIVAAAAAELRVGEAARSALSLTVYNNGTALVSETRRIELAVGATRLLLDDVSPSLRPETLLLSGPGLKVVEHGLATQVITQQRLLAAHLGKSVKLVRRHPETGAESFEDAELLGVAEDAIVRRAGRIESVPLQDIAFESLPAGLRPQPTLLATVVNADAGGGTLDMRYLAGGLNWQTDYIAELDMRGQSMKLSALVTLQNESGGSFRNAQLRLVAGELNQAPPPPMLRKAMPAEMMAIASADADVGAAQSLSERYLYEVPGRFDLTAGEIKQIPLFTAETVGFHRRFRFTDQPGYRPSPPHPVNADVVLELRNSDDSGLGRPLPAGTLRVYERTAAGAFIFSGEDSVRHAAVDATLEVRLGAAFDLTATARQTDFQRLDQKGASYLEARAVTLNNAKDEAVEMEVVAMLPRGARVMEENHTHEKLDAQRARWRIAVPANGQSDLEYRIQVTP